jgi:hypothetical protein
LNQTQEPGFTCSHFNSILKLKTLMWVTFSSFPPPTPYLPHGRNCLWGDSPPNLPFLQNCIFKSLIWTNQSLGEIPTHKYTSNTLDQHCQDFMICFSAGPCSLQGRFKLFTCIKVFYTVHTFKFIILNQILIFLNDIISLLIY